VAGDVEWVRRRRRMDRLSSITLVRDRDHKHNHHQSHFVLNYRYLPFHRLANEAEYGSSPIGMAMMPMTEAVVER